MSAEKRTFLFGWISYLEIFSGWIFGLAILCSECG